MGENMIFSTNYYLYNNMFLGNSKIAVGNFSTYCFNKHRTQSVSSAVSTSNQIVLKKIYNEFLERYRLGLNCSDETILTYDLISNKIKQRKRRELSYGYNKSLGFMDTTGTASGKKSSLVIDKALTELIEKNETFLMWILNKGYRLVLDKDLISIIKKYNLVIDDTFIFMSKSISNVYTFAVILFANKKIVSVGISLNKNENKGLIQALEESILLKFQNEKNHGRDNIYSHFSTKTNYKILNKIKYFNEKFIPIHISDLKDHEELTIKNFITNLEIAVLNTSSKTDNITIRCLSENLYNCIPSKQIISKNRREILNIFNINTDIINDMLPNIFI